MIGFSCIISERASVRASVDGTDRFDIQYGCLFANGGEYDAERVPRSDLFPVETPLESDRQIALAHYAGHRGRLALVQYFLSEFKRSYLWRDWTNS